LAHLEYADMIHYNQALAFAREAKWREAREELAESLTANNAFAPAYALLAKVYANEENWVQAKANVKKALSLMPEDDAIQRLAEDIVNAAPASSFIPAEESTRPEAFDNPPKVVPEPEPEPEAEHVLPVEPEPVRRTVPRGRVVEIPVEPTEEPKPVLTSMPADEPAGNRILHEHADTADIASLSEPLPWLRKAEPEVPATRLVHVSRTIPHPLPEHPETQQAAVESETPHPEETPADEPAAHAASQARHPSLLGAAAELFPEGSIWRAVGMGLLITAGLAILIRTISGEE